MNFSWSIVFDLQDLDRDAMQEFDHRSASKFSSSNSFFKVGENRKCSMTVR